MVLPRLKDDKAIGIANVDALEERGWQQPIYLHFGDIFPRGCGSYERDSMKGECADFHVLRLQDGKHSFYSVGTVIAYWHTYGESTRYVLPNVVQKRGAYTGIEEKQGRPGRNPGQMNRDDERFSG